MNAKQRTMHTGVDCVRLTISAMRAERRERRVWAGAVGEIAGIRRLQRERNRDRKPREPWKQESTALLFPPSRATPGEAFCAGLTKPKKVAARVTFVAVAKYLTKSFTKTNTSRIQAIVAGKSWRT